MNCRSIALVAVFGCAVAPAAAQELMPAAASVISRNIVARGEASRWSNVEVVRLRGVRNRNGYEQGLTAYLHRSGAVRVDLLLQSMVQVFLYDGQTARLKGLRESEFSPIPPDEAAVLLDELQKYLRWPDFWSDFAFVELDPESAAENGETDVLRVTTKEGEVELWTVDRTTGHVVAVLDVKTDGDQSYAVNTFAFEFREVEGVVFPFYTEMDSGTSMISIDVGEIEINPELEEGILMSLIGQAGGS